MRKPLRRHVLVPLSVVAITGLALAGCSSSPSGSGSSTGGHQTVTIYGADTSSEATQLASSWSAWAAKNNITIQYNGDKNFTTNIATKIQGNSLPDIAMFPQPGLLAAAIATGKVMPIDSATQSNVKNNFSADWQGYVTNKGKMYGTPLDASVKGYVWYSPAQFKTWGITLPKTYDELMTDTATIEQKTGKPPWCAGFNSGTASGWPGADQLAEMVLSSAGPKVYDTWVSGKTQFTDPAIGKAFDLLGQILQNPKYVNAGFGNIASINSTAFGDVATPLASGACAMTNQATFLEASFSTTKTAAGAVPKVGPDGDIWAFPLPAVKAGENAVTGGGDFAAAFNNNAATQKVMEYLSSADWANSLITVKDASFISANKGVDATKAADPLLQSAIKTLQDPNTTFRFGADDAMPNVVENAFWAGMVSWINATPTATVQQQIQAAWASAG
ncbi:ABC transporter substrate-binding protein [Rathayibacter soli]|uniref:ABC transporter substrate-binding protein n=1 Tax=Rathayibacter soli TaxID=3144168 RepID=UPI0027E4DD36|nr:extracellular solute-binding protein [Glaciibacter superstes]